MKILVVGPSWVGDMVMSQSLYRTLKALHPEAPLDVLAPAWCAPLLGRMPEVDNALTMPIGHGEFNLVGRWTLARTLAKSGYSHAYVLPNSLKSALIPLFAGIKTRIGWKGEQRYGLLNDLRSNKGDFPLMVERYVALAYSAAKVTTAAELPPILRPELRVDVQAQAAALERLQLNCARPILALCPGAEFGPAKRWPEEHYGVVAQRWIEQGGSVWIFGSQKDTPVAEAIRATLTPELAEQCHRLTGTTSLTEAIDLLALATQVISNDSGLMHIAAALNRPLVGIYGSTSPRYTPPLADKIEIVHTEIECRPCFKRTCPLGHLKCLKELYPEQVLAAQQRLGNAL